MFAIFSLIIAAASAFGALATNIWVRSQIREFGTKTSPDAGTSGETETISIDDYGKGSYALRELVSMIAKLDPKLHSVNLLLE